MGIIHYHYYMCNYALITLFTKQSRELEMLFPFTIAIFLRQQWNGRQRERESDEQQTENEE